MKYAGLALSLAFASTAACATEDEDNDAIAAEQAAASVGVGADLTSVASYFRGADALLTLPDDLARARAVSDVIDAVRAIVNLLDCVTIDTDNRTYLELHFDYCGVGPFNIVRLDGSIRAELSFESSPFALLFELSTVRFAISTGQQGIEIAGSMLIRDPLDDALPLQWTGGIALTSFDGASLSMSTASEWTVAGDCVTFSAETQLTINAMPERTEVPQLGTIVAASQGVTRCARECPSQGTVSIAYGAGKVLQWSYTGDGTAIVTGPGGRQFEVVLPCAR
jgi:hypothetical protein